jgi:hypothetical protein
VVHSAWIGVPVDLPIKSSTTTSASSFPSTPPSFSTQAPVVADHGLITVQWQSGLMLKSSTQLEERWRHVEMTDGIELRLVDLSAGMALVGRVPPTNAIGWHQIPTQPLLLPTTHVVESIRRSRLTVEASTVRPTVASISGTIPLYVEANHSIRLNRLAVRAQIEQIGALVALGDKVKGLISGLMAPLTISAPNSGVIATKSSSSDHLPDSKLSSFTNGKDVAPDADELPSDTTSDVDDTTDASTTTDNHSNDDGQQFYQDDFRSMKIDESDRFGHRPRAGHVSFSVPLMADEPRISSMSDHHGHGHYHHGHGMGDRWMSWRYPGPRSVTHITTSALLALRNLMASPGIGTSGRTSRVQRQTQGDATRPFRCTLSAYDDVRADYYDVFDFSSDLSIADSRILPTPGMVAEEWRISWTFPSSIATELIPSSLELGQLIRIDSASYPHLNTVMMVNINIPKIRLSLAEHAEMDLFVLRGRALNAHLWMWQDAFMMHRSGMSMLSQPTTPSLSAISPPSLTKQPSSARLQLAAPLSSSMNRSLSGRFIRGSGRRLILRAEISPLWLSVYHYRDLTTRYVLHPMPLRATLRLNNQQIITGGTPGTRVIQALPVAVHGHSEVGAEVDIETGNARVDVGRHVLMMATKLATAFQRRFAKTAHVMAARSSSTSTGESTPLGIESVTQAPAPLHSFAHYVVSNECGLPIGFGQWGTNEEIILQHSNDTAYIWNSISPSLAYPVGAPPGTTDPSLITAATSVPHHIFHWLRLRAASSTNHSRHADDRSLWSQPFIIDPLPVALPSDASTTVSNSSNGAKASNPMSVPLREPSLIRLELRINDESPLPTAAPAAGSSSSSSAPQQAAIGPSGRVTSIYVHVHRQGLATHVTFLPTHFLCNQLPFSVTMRLELATSLDATATTKLTDYVSLPTHAHLPSSSSKGIRITLPSRSRIPLPLWRPVPGIVLPLPKGAKPLPVPRAGKGAPSTAASPPLALIMSVRINDDAAHILATTQGRPSVSMTMEEKRPSAAPSFVDFWSWADAFTINLHTPMHTTSSWRVAQMQHKLDVNQQLFFWCHSTHLGGGTSMKDAPMSLSLWPAFVVATPLSQPVRLLLRPSLTSHDASPEGSATNNGNTSNNPSFTEMDENVPDNHRRPHSALAELQEEKDLFDRGLLMEPNQQLSFVHLDPRTPITLAVAMHGMFQ